MVLQTEINEKTSLASGDSIKTVPDEYIRKSRRIVVPSSRRFGTRSLSQNSKKIELKRAIDELSSPTPRKKALTIAEITPTRDKTCIENVPEDCLSSRKNKERAGRKIYEVLLLHSWRKQKTRISVLTESLRSLEAQNRKLKSHIEALEYFQNAETQKCNDAESRAHRMNRKNEEIINKNNALREEKQSLENELKVCQEKLTNTQIQLEDLQKDLQLECVNLKNCEHKLSLENKKNKRLRAEKRTYETQDEMSKQELDQYREHLKELQNNLLNADLKYRDSIASNEEYKKTTKILSEKLEREISVNRKLQNYNKKLNYSFLEIKKVLHKEQNRPWWKSAGDLGLAFISSLKIVAGAMLPLMPHTDTV